MRREGTGWERRQTVVTGADSDVGERGERDSEACWALTVPDTTLPMSFSNLILTTTPWGRGYLSIPILHRRKLRPREKRLAQDRAASKWQS